MKAFGVLILLIGLGLGIAGVVDLVSADYQYSSQFQSYWDLADKSSSLSQKSTYLDQFVSALENSGLSGQNDAMFFPTPSNSFDQNMVALKSLQQRMHDVQSMDPNSFQYNTAIEQITSQEQGQAQDMLDVFSGVWYKVHHYELWNGFIGLVWIILTILFVIAGGAMLFSD